MGGLFGADVARRSLRAPARAAGLRASGAAATFFAVAGLALGARAVAAPASGLACFVGLPGFVGLAVPADVVELAALAGLTPAGFAAGTAVPALPAAGLACFARVPGCAWRWGAPAFVFAAAFFGATAFLAATVFFAGTTVVLFGAGLAPDVLVATAVRPRPPAADAFTVPRFAATGRAGFDGWGRVFFAAGLSAARGFDLAAAGFAAALVGDALAGAALRAGALRAETLRAETLGFAGGAAFFGETAFATFLAVAAVVFLVADLAAAFFAAGVVAGLAVLAALAVLAVLRGCALAIADLGGAFFGATALAAALLAAFLAGAAAFFGETAFAGAALAGAFFGAAALGRLAGVAAGFLVAAVVLPLLPRAPEDRSRSERGAGAVRAAFAAGATALALPPVPDPGFVARPFPPAVAVFVAAGFDVELLRGADAFTAAALGRGAACFGGLSALPPPALSPGLAFRMMPPLPSRPPAVRVPSDAALPQIAQG